MASKAGMTIEGIVAMAIGVLGLIIIYTVVPLVGSEMDQAVVLPGCVDDNATCANGTELGGRWNSSVDSDVPTAVSLWTSLAGILKVAAFIVVFAIILKSFYDMRG